ncbi:Uncharacterised protein [Mycobacteroides abscessus]|nr:Uncharacterised protein [Mycobacteroides abscessus]
MRTNSTPSTADGSSTTTASPSASPFLVPPNDSTSTPASVVRARSGTPSAAAAFARRDPSRCTRMPRACAASATARISSAV